MNKKKRAKLKRLAKELYADRTNFMRKHILDMALFWGVVRIVSKRKPLPKWNEFPEDPCTTYQAYELVDDRVS